MTAGLVVTALRTKEVETLRDLWGLPLYASASNRDVLIPLFCAMTHAAPPATVLDAGCGTGAAAVALAQLGYQPTLIDLVPSVYPEAAHLPFAIASVWDDLRAVVGPVDWVYCADVLEWLPPGFAMLAVHQFLAVATAGVWVSMSTQPAPAWSGRTIPVPSFLDWRRALEELGDVVECRDLLTSGAYLVRRRC